jgi:hypothetical protein
MNGQTKWEGPGVGSPREPNWKKPSEYSPSATSAVVFALVLVRVRVVLDSRA